MRFLLSFFLLPSIALGCSSSSKTAATSSSGDSGLGPFYQSDAAVDVYTIPATRPDETLATVASQSPDAAGATTQAIAIAADDVGVYWQTPGGAIYACPLAGCAGAAPTLLSSLVGSQFVTLDTLTASNGNAVFVSGGGTAITTVPFAHPTSTTTLDPTDAGPGTFDGLATDGAHVFILQSDTDTNGNTTSAIVACPVGGSCDAPTTVYSSDNGSGIGLMAVGSGLAVFSEENCSDECTLELRAVPTSGGSARTICSTSKNGVYPTTVAVVGAYVYFTGGEESADIYECALTGGQPPVLFVEDYAPYALATDGNYLYWTNYVPSTGTVAGCRIGPTCSAPFTVASGLDLPFAITATATHVYWTTAETIDSATIP